MILGEAVLNWYSINLKYSVLGSTLIVLRNVPWEYKSIVRQKEI